MLMRSFSDAPGRYAPSGSLLLLDLEVISLESLPGLGVLLNKKLAASSGELLPVDTFTTQSHWLLQQSEVNMVKKSDTATVPSIKRSPKPPGSTKAKGTRSGRDRNIVKQGDLPLIC